METASNKKIVSQFISAIWNEQKFDRMDQWIHNEFIDHSLPDALPPNKVGMIKWITATSLSFGHQTIIEEILAEGDKVVVKLRMELTHTGTWRALEPTGIEIITKGYRLFRIKDGLILEHWGLIDGQAIENQIKKAAHGCKIPQ